MRKRESAGAVVGWRGSRKKAGLTIPCPLKFKRQRFAAEKNCPPQKATGTQAGSDSAQTHGFRGTESQEHRRECLCHLGFAAKALEDVAEARGDGFSLLEL